MYHRRRQRCGCVCWRWNRGTWETRKPGMVTRESPTPSATPHDAPTSPGRRGVLAVRAILTHPTFWALVGALAFAAVYGRVAVSNLTYGVVGGNSNGYEDVWNDYWLKTAISLHRNPFYT